MSSVLKGIIRVAVLSLAVLIISVGCSGSSAIIVKAPTVTEKGQYDGDRAYRLVSMECSDASATIYYTNDGSTPVKGSPIYSPSSYTNVQGEEYSSVLVLAGSTIKVRAYRNKVLSEVVTLTVSGDTKKPTITEKGVYGENIAYRLVEIMCVDSDATIYYTTDGSTPSTGSTAYEPDTYTDYSGEEFESILVPAGSEVKAVTYKEGVYSSLVTLTVTDVTPAPEVEDKGEYDEGAARLIELSCSDVSATIYYTIDGDDPSSESTEYSPEFNTAVSGDSLETIVLPAGTTVKAIAYRDGIPSEVSVHSIASYLSAPTVTDKGPYKFNSNYRLISLTCNDSAATIYYTTNGDEPTTASDTYSPTTNEDSDKNMVEAVAVQVGTTLKVVAIKGNETSDVRTYQVSTPPAAPTFTDRGQYSEDRTYRLLQVSCSDYYADIHYTTDGSTPTVSSEKYNPDRFTDIFGSQYECIKVPAGTTVKAISRKNRISSTVTEYNIGSSVAAPTVTNKGQYSDDKTKWLVQIGSTDTSSTIYYTTNGNMPTVNSTRYSETANTNVSGTSHNSVRVTAGSTLKAVAYKDETYSNVVTFTVPSVTVMPTITDMGQYSGNRANRLIKLECSDSTATIYYTTDGTEPTTRSTRYSAGSYSNISGTSVSAVLVPAGSTLKAMAYKDGVYSTVRSYTVPSAITAPTVTDRGQYNADRSKWLVQLGSTDTSATIYYTTDGTNPTTSSTRYSANSNTNVNGSSYNSMRVSAGSTLKAVAYKNGTYSDLTSFSVPSAVSTPSFTDRGQYSGDWSKWLVQIGCTDTSATIYYTTDRTEPTTSSSRYTAGSYTSVSGSSYSSIQVPAGSTMKAMAYKDGVYSAVATFSVPSAVSTPTVRVMGQYRYDNTKRLVQVSCSDSSATIYYTTDGNDPSTSSTRYSTNYLPNVSGNSYDSIIVAEGATLKVMAYKNGVYSPVTTYNVPSKPVAPTVTDRGQYNADRSKWLVQLGSTDTSATIYYTTDGTNPTTSSTRYSANSNTNVNGSSYNSMRVSAGSTLKAVAFKDDAYSDVYTFSVPSAILTPTINDKGQYDSDRSYRLFIVTCSDSSATIYYTTNGTNPTTSSSRYSESTYKSVDGNNYSSLKVPAGSTLKVCAYKNGVYSPVTSYSVPSAISTPTVTYRGQYSSDRSYRLITLSCSNSSATIYYTTNGSTPTTSSSVYSSGYYSNTSGSYYYSILVPAGSTLKAVAYYNGAYSDVYTYSVPSAISTPTVTYRGQYSSDRSYRLITLSCSNSSATIYYTTNGTNPTTSSTRYSANTYTDINGNSYSSIKVSAGSTLKAVAYYDGAYSDVYTYSVPSAISMPTVTYGGQYSSDRSYRLITLSCSNSSATIYYTTNGSTPTTSSTRYSSSSYTNVNGYSYYSMIVPAGSTLKAVAYYDGAYSDVYTYSVPSAISTPTVTYRGQYSSDRSYRLITLSCSNSSATIYYTTNGSTPTTSSSRYSYNVGSYTNVNGYSYYSVIVPAGSTLKAIAYYDGAYSDVYTYSVPSAISTPTITDIGQYNSDRSYRLITLSCSNSSATIYYTTNGSSPTTSSTRYSSSSYTNVNGVTYSSIKVSAGSTLKAVAYYDGAYSDVYTYSVPSAISTPTITDRGQYNSDRSYRLVTLSCSNSSATIYYTTNGSTPTTSSSVYSSGYYSNTSGSYYYSIPVPAGSTLKAVAYYNGAYSNVYTYSVPSAISTPTLTDMGQYSGNRSFRLIKLECSDSTSTIYYTTDGTEPTTRSTRYSAGSYNNIFGTSVNAVLVPAGSTMKAMAYKDGVYSTITTYYVPSKPVTPTATDRGQYGSDWSKWLVTLACSDSSATIYYTTDGTEPTTSTTRISYSSSSYYNVNGSSYRSTKVPAGSTLKAVAYYDGAYSDVHTYSVPSAISTPTITDRGQYNSDRSYRLITLSCSNLSATIYYTTNGSTPTTSSTRYSSSSYTNVSGVTYSSIKVPAGSTLKVCAYKDGVYSPVTSYSVPSAISTPTITDRGQYYSDRSYRLITLSCSNSSATIYYTTNGSTPTTSSSRYSYNVGSYTNVNGVAYNSIKVPAGSTLKAVAYYNGSYSNVVSYTVPNPSISINTNGQWQSYSSGLSSSDYYSYQSYSNKNVDNSTATMYLTISGYDTFTLYIRSYAESSYDYTIAYEADSNTIKSDTRTSNNTSNTSLSSYKRVDYTGLGGTSHTIRIVYRKDVSISNGDDRGYLVIPKNQ